MEAYAKALNYAIPFFVILILIEAFAAYRMGKKINRGADAISSLSSGITNSIKDVLELTLAIVSYEWLVMHLAIFEIKATLAVYLIGFVVIDFAGYWMHRLNHEINVLWNRHIIHHSSEEFNLSCALRQSISTFFSFIAIFMVPAALLGVPAEVIGIIAPIHLFAQFWYHTRLIDKMGFLEYFLVTPSHHRVHHAMNPEYLDKNYGQVFIFWDKWFGTFQPELSDVEPVYGVKRPVATWNPVLINFQHLWLLFLDAWRTKNWRDKFRLWFMHTGYRPKDVAEKYPVEIVEDFSKFEKYRSNPSQTLLAWSWFQLVMTLAFMFHLFNNIKEIGMPYNIIYGLFIVVGIFSYTTLMDKSRFALSTEFVRMIFGFALLYLYGGDWFGLSNLIAVGPYFVAAYFLISFVVTFYLFKTESVKEKGLPGFVG